MVLQQELKQELKKELTGILTDRPATEAELNNVAGVVTNGIFARRPADVLLLAEGSGIRKIGK